MAVKRSIRLRGSACVSAGEAAIPSSFSERPERGRPSGRDLRRACQGADCLKLPGAAGGPQDSPKIPVALKVEPEVGVHPEEPLEAQGRVRCNAPLRVHQLIQSRIGNLETLGDLYLC